MMFMSIALNHAHLSTNIMTSLVVSAHGYKAHKIKYASISARSSSLGNMHYFETQA